MEPKIYATGNEAIEGKINISYYVFEKDESFLDWLERLVLEVLGDQGGRHNVKCLIKEENGEEIVYVKNIKKMIDVHEKYSNKGERVDVFYGKERVYVTLRHSEEIRKRFAKFIRKTRSWIKVKEVQKVPVYVKKKN